VKKRSVIFCMSLLLVSSAVMAADENCNQDKTERPRVVTISSPSFLGVDLREVNSESAQRLKLRSERGARVERVTAGSAAEKAGLQKDDVIVKWNGEAIESARAMSRHIRETPAGRSVRLGVVRDGSEREINVTLGDRHEYVRTFAVDASRVRERAAERIRERTVARPAVVRSYVRAGSNLGISVQGMSPQLAEYFGLKDRNGALVTFVHPDSTAAKAGIKAGDVILSIGGESIEGPGNVLRVLRTKSEGAVEVKIMRDRQERSVTVQLEKDKNSSLIFSPDDFDGVIIDGPDIVIAPMPQIAVKIPTVRMSPVVVPQVHVAPVAIPPIHIAPVVIPQVRIVPMTMPKVVIPKFKFQKLMLPPQLVMPYRIFTRPV